MNIGIIGYGELGSRLGQRLLQHDYVVYGFDICESAMDMLDRDGVIMLFTPSDVAKKCEIIITCVDDNLSVKQCVLGENGIINGVNKNTTIIEMTTSTPETTQKIGEELKKQGADIIDAPVSRGIPAAEEGTLSILVGGNKRTLERCRPVLDILGTDIVYCGDLGTGHAVKAINMMMMACNLLATSEAVSLGLKEGLDLEKILEVINVSSGENYMTSHHFPKYVINNSYHSNFSLGLMIKDLNIAIKMTEDLKLSSLMGKRASHLYNLFATNIPLEKDNMETVKEIQYWMGGV